MNGRPAPGRGVRAGGVHALDGGARPSLRSMVARPCQSTPYGEPASSSTWSRGDRSTRTSTCSRTSIPGRASATRMSSASRPRPSSVQACAARREPCRWCAPPAACVAVQHHLVRQVGHLADEAEVADHRRDRRHRARDVGRQRRQPPRVDRADDHVGVEARRGRCRRRRPGRRPAEVAGGGPEQDASTRRSPSRLVIASARTPIRRARSRRRSSARRRTTCPSRRARCAGRARPSASGAARHGRSRSSLNALVTLRCSDSRVRSSALRGLVGVSAE